MDKAFYEKLSIRDSAKSLKKYGSTSRHVTRNENYIKHYVSNTDTLQGIALKYDVTIEQIRRVNRLWASDSLFLKEYLLIPVPEGTPASSSAPTPILSPSQAISPTTTNNSSDEDNIDDFLGKIDAKIANTKEEIRKTENCSEFSSNRDVESERRKITAAHINNNGSCDFLATPQAVVVQQGRKVRSSLRQHEKQQAELFEL